MAETKKRNFYISYLKGFSILCIICIHLIDWSNLELSPDQKLWKELLYPSVLFFIALVGTVVYIAYRKKPFREASLRLITRGLQLIGIYFLYNLVKLWIYDFSKEPFFLWQFSEKHVFDWQHILTLQAFSVPITIIFTIGVLLILSPLFLYLATRLRYGKAVILLLILLLLGLNYGVTIPRDGVIAFLYSEGYVHFPILLWLMPYLIGFFLAMIGFEKHKGLLLALFGGLTLLSLGLLFQQHQAWLITWYMYPLQPYYIFFSFFWMYFLIYVFAALEKIRAKSMYYFLAGLRVLGDFTLSLYVCHWIVVDLTIWWFTPNYQLIWWTVFFLLILFLMIKRRKLGEYAEEYQRAK